MIRFKVVRNLAFTEVITGNRTYHPRWDQSTYYGTDELNLSLIPAGTRDSAFGGFWWLGSKCQLAMRTTTENIYNSYVATIGNSSYSPIIDGYDTNGNPLDLHLSDPDIVQYALSVRLICDATAAQKSLSNGTIISNAHTDRDDNSYSAVKIGNYLWLTENYRCSKLFDGDNINTAAMTNSQWAAYRSPAACLYPTPQGNLSDQSQMLASYGYLYNFEAINWGLGGSGVGNSDFRVPTIFEFNAMMSIVGSTQKIRSIE